MSAQTNEYNLNKIKQVWNNLEESFKSSGYKNKNSYLKDALGYIDNVSGIGSLGIRLKRYTGDNVEEYDRLLQKMTAADELLQTIYDVSNLDLDYYLQEQIFDRENASVVEEESDDVVEIDVEARITPSNDVLGLLNTGFMCDTFVYADGAIIHLALPADPDYLCIRSESEFKIILATLASRLNEGQKLSKFESCIFFNMLKIVLNKRKIDVPIVFASSKYFRKYSNDIMIGKLSTGKYKMRENKVDRQKYDFKGRSYHILDYHVYKSYIRDCLGNRYTCYFVEV